MLYALAAGDEPAACKELYDLAVSMGFTIVAAGKGKNNPLDRHATPADPAVQKEAARRGLSPNMLIEFVDGSKTMIEMAAVSNATGLVPDVRGMHGPTTDRDHLDEAFALREDGGVLSRIGVVDYGVGHVAPGVFLIVRTDHPRLREAMVLRDMGDGPYYTLFRPFHLCSIEVPLTCAMLAIRKRSNMAPLDRLSSEVFAVAKRDLAAGDTLDAIGGTTYYSLIDTYEAAKAEGLLPIGLAKGARLVRPVRMDTPITYADVEIEPSTVLSLRRLQEPWFEGAISEPDLLAAVDALAHRLDQGENDGKSNPGRDRRQPGLLPGCPGDGGASRRPGPVRGDGHRGGHRRRGGDQARRRRDPRGSQGLRRAVQPEPRRASRASSWCCPTSATRRAWPTRCACPA